ncbi:hypothetical protein [Halobellus salinisoli]|uniref:hypothetical protein n=1 Tax=Halobellus salinisoli TaxID=3108500 RepID=UPI0030096454
MTLRDPAQSVAESVDGDRAVALLESVRDHELPPVLRELVAEYQSLDGARPWFMWRWVHRLAPKNTVPVVDNDRRETVATDKTILVLFITVLDDLLESQSDYETFEVVCELVRSGIGGGPVGTPRPDSSVNESVDGAINEAYVAFARSVWETLLDRLERSPSFDRYAPLFRFDVRQITTAIEYSALVIDRPDLATATDLRHYEVHNMGMNSYLDIDLMHASVDYTGELDALRAVVDPAQRMARIGNWLSTWERELREGDVSSGVVVAALEGGLVDADQFTRRENEAVADVEESIDRIRAADIERELLDEWNEEYRRLVSLSDRVDAVDMDQFVAGTKDVLRYHLASRGLK